MAAKCGGTFTREEPQWRDEIAENEVQMKAVRTYSTVVLGIKSCPEHSGWRDQMEVREHSHKRRVT